MDKDTGKPKILLDVDDAGPKHPRCFTKDRFLNICDDELTLSDCRFFLHCHVSLSDCFNGNGSTADQHGKRGCEEYLIKNMELNNVRDLRLIKLNVTTPRHE